jgi:DNA-binding response OmpR family regulator
MQWDDIRALVPVGTSQGGTVYYLKAVDCRHQLLPQRIERFDLFLDVLNERSAISTKGIGRLTPPWTYQILALLMPPGLVRSRQELLRMAWPPFSGGPRSVDTQVLTLRRKLEQAGLGEGGGITTVRQRGYRFSLDNLPAN